jgi:hypothetical protein
MHQASATQIDQQPARLYFLNWLRVIAILGVYKLNFSTQTLRNLPLFGSRMGGSPA